MRKNRHKPAKEFKFTSDITDEQISAAVNYAIGVLKASGEWYDDKIYDGEEGLEPIGIVPGYSQDRFKKKKKIK